MVDKTAFQVIVLFYLETCVPPGTMLEVDDLYETFRNLLQNGAPPGSPDNVVTFFQKLRTVANRGDLPNEARYKNDIRWALRRAKASGLIRHHGTQRSGRWRRI